jgi:hypothetical protein
MTRSEPTDVQPPVGGSEEGVDNEHTEQGRNGTNQLSERIAVTTDGSENATVSE